MFPDYDFIKMLYGWNAVKPSTEWYVEHGNITAEQYQTITGKAYVSTEA
ncbi:XkdX family protein [Lactiplantibacillus mudanjiangensis]|uniref:XkdX family protein n=1 Tax=Lactiplantibacillus mudanjiangensis TaxID=1296538 RepID=A0A660E850_9LACO|nr:XkdX family protein [Lactiplantibacillus mudanjiangensis]VDG24245.1 hypothetical protein MUDAN_IGPPGNFN_02514 [Lactiplantibacillus mudanjiangensis]VDG30223.1 hypothetical protein MUDAN_MDHGFNIF_01776 [Lactiplantibacillus mudanjiangensis]